MKSIHERKLRFHKVIKWEIPLQTVAVGNITRLVILIDVIVDTSKHCFLVCGSEVSAKWLNSITSVTQ